MQISITQTTIPNYQGTGSTATVRLYSSKAWLTYDGDLIQKSKVGGPTWYKEIDCTVAGDVLTIPAFTIDSTVDGAPATAKYTLAVFDANGNSVDDGLLKHFYVPDDLGATLTFAQLVAVNADSEPNVPGQTYSQSQVNVLVAAQVPGFPKGTELTYGTVKLSVPAASTSIPIAVGDNDPRIIAETSSGAYATLDAAITAIGSTNTTLVISTAIAQSASTLTVPSTCQLRFVGIGVITVGSGKTLTINSVIDAPARPIFSGLGTFTLTGSKNTTVPPEWWGATGDFNAGTLTGTDDRTAILAAIASVPSGGTVKFACKNYYIGAGSLTITRQVKLQGDGRGIYSSTTLLLTDRGTSLYFDTTQHGIIANATGGEIVEVAQMAIRPKSTTRVASGGKHGIWMKSRMVVTNVVVAHFSGSGIEIGSGINNNTNLWKIDDAILANNTLHGLHICGPTTDDGADTVDTNGGTAIGIDVRDNQLDGVYDESAFGNSFVGTHASYNVHYGMHTISAGTQDTRIYGGYAENNTLGSIYCESQPGTIIFGGTWSPAPTGNGLWIYKDLGDNLFRVKIRDTNADVYTEIAGGYIRQTNIGGNNRYVTVPGVATFKEFLTAGGNYQWKDASDNIFLQAVATAAGEKVIEAAYGFRSGAKIAPTTNDGAALGDTTHNFSDLFLATGAVLNYNNGNVVVTHSSGILTMGTGEMRITSPGTNSASVVTVGGSQSLTGKNLAGATVAMTGAVTSSGTAGVGYATGAGGAVTQATNRTTAVSIDKTTGAITLISAAGSTSPQSFTVNNSTVAATDIIILNQKSGTDKYTLSVTAVGAGSFEITYNTKSGTTTEQPVFNFAVIKGVVS